MFYRSTPENPFLIFFVLTLFQVIILSFEYLLIFSNNFIPKSSVGGLFVLGTERHESRRIDNQLRGRSGRQGDPGNSIFYISLEDDLMRIFGSESIDGIN